MQQLEQLKAIVQDESLSADLRDAAQAQLRELEPQAQQQQQRQQPDVPEPHGGFWGWYVQDTLQTIVDEAQPLSRRVQCTNSVWNRYGREAYDAAYKPTAPDLALLQETLAKIMTRPDGTHYLDVPASVWV